MCIRQISKGVRIVDIMAKKGGNLLSRTAAKLHIGKPVKETKRSGGSEEKGQQPTGTRSAETTRKIQSHNPFDVLGDLPDEDEASPSKSATQGQEASNSTKSSVENQTGTSPATSNVPEKTGNGSPTSSVQHDTVARPDQRLILASAGKRKASPADSVLKASTSDEVKDSGLAGKVVERSTAYHRYTNGNAGQAGEASRSELAKRGQTSNEAAFSLVKPEADPFSSQFDVEKVLREMPDWRNPPSDLQQNRHKAASTMLAKRRGFVPGTQASRRSRMTYAPGPRTVRGLLHVDQEPGVIVWRWDIRPHMRGKKVPVGWEYFKATSGRDMIRKGRYWIIIKVTGAQIQECPIYTNHDTGLKHTPEKLKPEYMSVRPKHVPGRGFVNQSPANEVLVIEWMQDKKDGIEGRLVRETMVVHTTEVSDRDVNDPHARLVGALAELSTQKLLAKQGTAAVV